MTAQIDDLFLYKGTEYCVAGISEGELFDPAILEMEPAMVSTDCYRGYQAVYAVVDGHLVVADLHINLLQKKGDDWERKAGPPINGIIPEGPDEEARCDFFDNHYTGINYHLEYSGGLLLADGFISDLYVHMGFQAAWKYERVIELVFENGVLTAEYDRSEKMAEIRELRTHPERKPSSHLPSGKDMRTFIEQAFDRKYTRGL